MHLTRYFRAAALASLTVVVLLVVASVAGLVLGAGGLYGDPTSALGPAAATAGILVPGFLGHDVFNLIVGVPVRLGTVWLARRDSIIALLLWPGALSYTLYTFALYLIAAPFSGLFLVYVVLVALSAFTTAVLVVGIDAGAVQGRLESAIPARLVGGLLLGLALLTIAQDAWGAISTALTGGSPTNPPARPVWAVDLSIEAPAVLLGGLLLWVHKPLGYVAAAGLLLHYGLTPLALAFGLVLQAIVTGSALDRGTVFGVLGFSVVCFAPLTFMIRATMTRPARPARGPRVATSAI